MRHVRLVKLASLAALLAAVGVVLLTGRLLDRRAYAYSAGPPAGFTSAPGEFDCRECHLPDGAPSGTIQISAPQSYAPGQTYQITVSVANSSPTRRRWGFQLTAVDDTGNRAGTLAPGADGFTQVIPGTLGSPARQYAEHTTAGTFTGQPNGASWTFSWTAPGEPVGPVLLYAAGNQANNDGNSSGDSINFTFATIQQSAQPPDFTVAVTPSSQTILPGASGTYTVTVTPTNGFTGTVTLSAAGLPAGASAAFNPASVQITDASAKTSTLTVTNGAATPLGSFAFSVNAAAGGVTRAGAATLVTGPTVLDPGVAVRMIASGLDQPISVAVLAPGDLFVLEKASGRVKRVAVGGGTSTVLDLAVNSASERGLLGVALHPQFPQNPRVYLYWTESSTGADTVNPDEVPLLGNRIDSYLWNGAQLAHERNLIRLRALQQDAGQPSRGNHDGGVLRFGPDGKLYAVVGDLGRRGLMQNLRFGPSQSPDGPAVADDQFGGPEPDNNHLSGVVLRLNDDGTTPTDNPFFDAATGLPAEAAANVRKVYAYGVRNSFGMDFDPQTGQLWTQENGDDAFDEINRVTAGFNGGWIQLMGPSSRVAQFRQIEMERAGGLQQLRWPPDRIAQTPAEALARLFALPGSHYREPEFSWKYAVAPAAVGFVRGNFGPNMEGRLLVGASRTTLLGGFLFRMPLDAPRRSILATSPETADRVADNPDKFTINESETFDFGRDFGVVTDIRNDGAGGVLVVSLSNGAIYELRPKANSVGLLSTSVAVQEGEGTAVLLIQREGDVSGPATVEFRTLDFGEPAPCAQSFPGAFAKCDYTSVRTTVTFAPGQTGASVAVPITADAHDENTEFISVGLLNPMGTSVGDAAVGRIDILDDDAPGAQNPLDDSAFFVRQHYLDFLAREPDPAGLGAWLGVLGNCPNRFNTDPLSVSARCDRIHVSSSFFRSREFYEEGYLVYRFYKATLGRMPFYDEISADMARMTGATEAEVLARRDEFAAGWLLRPEVAARYPATLTDAAFVDKLLQTAGVALTAPDPVSGATRESLVADLRAGRRTRAEVARAVAESAEVDAKEFNGAFVAMQYFGYLRRDPEQPGYQNWLNYLNANPTDFRTMVNGFVNSVEYRLRFGPTE